MVREMGVAALSAAPPEVLADRGLIDTDDYTCDGVNTGPVHHLKEVTAEEIAVFQCDVYRRFYLRPTKLARRAVRIKTLYRLRGNFVTAWGVLRLILGRGGPRNRKEERSAPV